MIRAATPHPVDTICEVIEAHFWDWDDDRAMQAMADLDEAGQSLLGYLYRSWTLSGGKAELVDPFGTIIDLAFSYIKHGDDPVIVSRLSDCLSDDLHQEQLARMDAEVEAEIQRDRAEQLAEAVQ